MVSWLILHALQALPICLHEQVRLISFADPWNQRPAVKIVTALPPSAACTACRVTCSVAASHPGDVVELAPAVPPLQEAATEEQHQQSVAEQQKQVCQVLHQHAFCSSALQAGVGNKPTCIRQQLVKSSLTVHHYQTSEQNAAHVLEIALSLVACRIFHQPDLLLSGC